MKSLIPFILIGLSIGAYYTYMAPTFAEIQDLSTKKGEYVSAFEKIQNLAVKRDEMMAAYRAVPAPSMDRVRKIIPDTLQAVDLANDINTVASHSGMTIQGFKVAETQANIQEKVISKKVDSLYKTYHVSFNVKGQYSQFVRFLKELETNAYLSDVRSIGIQPAGTKDVSDSYTYTIEFTSYSLR